MEFRVIDNISPEWNELIRKSTVYDFYHTSFYHQIDTEFDSKLLYFGTNESFIALPVVIRPINDTDYFDITSVYGYSGPIYKYANPEEKESLILFFKNKFVEFCRQNNIISVFHRLHPIIEEQKDILQNLGELIPLNDTVSIDLSISVDDQRKQYRKSLKSELNQLRKKKIEIQAVKDKKSIDEFISIYYDTMDRVNAYKKYYFSKDYFYNFLNNTDFNSKLLVARVKKEMIAGAIFTNTNTIMQYHLSATKRDFYKLAPMKLILDEARIIGNYINANELHLGGGVGGNDEDTLFRFKSAFSKKIRKFSVWKYVVDENIYNQLSTGKEKSDYFPLYRS